jgi:O-antigen/teichoic acid export membrane protein
MAIYLNPAQHKFGTLCGPKKVEGEKAYWDAVQKLFRIYALLGWIGCIPTVLFSHMAISILYGDEYKDGATVLSIYVFTNTAINMGVAQAL